MIDIIIALIIGIFVGTDLGLIIAGLMAMSKE